MSSCGSNLSALGRVSSLYLDYGADAQGVDDDAIALCERGLTLRSRWKFDFGTQLSASFVYHRADGTDARVTAEGIVVDCEPTGGEYESTLLFLDPPEALQRELRAFSQLAGTEPALGIS